MELFSPDFGLIFWMFVTVLLLVLLLGKFGWPFIVKSLEERANLIDKGVEYAQEAKAQLENAQKEAAKYVTEAQKQQAEILREAAKMKTQIIDEAKNAAAIEAKKVMDAAKVSIEQARKESEMQFRSEVSQFALQIAEKVVRRDLTGEKSQAELVDKLLKEVETKN